MLEDEGIKIGFSVSDQAADFDEGQRSTAGAFPDSECLLCDSEICSGFSAR